jgi:hypothetical protein
LERIVRLLGVFPKFNAGQAKDYGDSARKLSTNTCFEMPRYQQQLFTFSRKKTIVLRESGNHCHRWKCSTKDIFRPAALAIQNPRARTVRKVTNILAHLESEHQVNETEFSSFYKFVSQQTISSRAISGTLEGRGGWEERCGLRPLHHA